VSGEVIGVSVTTPSKTMWVSLSFYRCGGVGKVFTDAEMRLDWTTALRRMRGRASNHAKLFIGSC